MDGRKEFNYVVTEEEIKVEEEWVQNEYDNKVVQHVINMNQSNNWVDVLKDVEIRIAKKKVVRIRYIAKHSRYVLDYEKMANKIRSKDIKDVKRRRLLGFLEFPKGDTAGYSKHRIERDALGRTQLKAARTSSVTVLDAKEVERKQMEEEDEIWEKNIVCKTVPMAAKCTGKWITGKTLPWKRILWLWRLVMFLSKHSKCCLVDGWMFQLENISRLIFTSIPT